MEFRSLGTITVGRYPTKYALCEAVSNTGNQISAHSRYIIEQSQFILLAKLTPIDLYTATVKEITGKDRATTEEIWAILSSLECGEGPDETALYFRMAYKDQPIHEWLAVVSNPIPDSVGRPCILGLDRDENTLWVRRVYARPEGVWRGDKQLVFVRK